MTIDKISGANAPLPIDSRSSVAAESAVKLQAEALRSAASQAAPAQAAQQAQQAASNPVKVSAVASEMLQAVKSAASEEPFDQKKVDRLRKEIAEGRVPLDAEKLARKFLALEKELGSLGRQ